MIIPIPLFRFAAIDHVIVEQVVVSATFPDLRMHNNGAIETGHLVSAGRTGFYDEFIVCHDHIVPPCIFDIAFEQNAERTVVPESV
jgi:hypothetical protein